MNEQERREFRSYCRTLCDRQVEGVIERERTAWEETGDEYRRECLQLAEFEAELRELDV